MSQPYVGQIMMFAGNFAPAGWMTCEGQTLAISENDTLFNLIGTTYGGDGQSTFALPDLQGRVVVHGPLSTEEVGSLYGAADLFVLPSLKEPYGTVYGEAMAYGLPVVGWRAGNLPYLAEHEKEGLLAEPGDLAGLAQAIYRLSTDEQLRARLGEAAKQRALQRPTWKESAALFYGALRDAGR